MKSIFWASVFLTGSVFAEDVPRELLRNLKPYATQRIDLKGDVLRVTVAKPIVTNDMYRLIVVGAVCGSLWTGKGGWGSAKIERAEVVNDLGAQGFAMINLKRTCDAIATAKGDEYKPLVDTNTIPCVVGECRKR
jgi:hypothetical protein